MKTNTFNGKLTPEERETTITYSDIDHKWYAETSVAKHYRRFIKQGWTQTSLTSTPDGDFISAEFECSEKAISIRNVPTTKRVISEEHKAKLLAARQIKSENYSK